tara:strand:- start:23071 stop:23325 length:255 start_codon:yes stop_codon:yes gene_type:complete
LSVRAVFVGATDTFELFIALFVGTGGGLALLVRETGDALVFGLAEFETAVFTGLANIFECRWIVWTSCQKNTTKEQELEDSMRL